MYNRYLDTRDAREIPLQEPEPGGRGAGPAAGKEPAPGKPRRGGDILSEVTGGLGDLLGGLFKNISLDKLDAGDILLVLIILFLYLEGDNLELVITLGLMLLFGLGEGQGERQDNT